MSQPEVPAPKTIKLTEVRYGMTVSLPNYENVRFDLAAEVGPDDDWREVLESLRRKGRNIRKRITEEGS